MNASKLYLGVITLAVALLLVLASLQACQPAAPKASGTEVTGTVSLIEEDFEDPPDLFYWKEGETSHVRNLIAIAEGVYSDHRLDGKMLANFHVDGTRVPGMGIYGHYWGHALILDPDEQTVTWEGDYAGMVDADWNEVYTHTLQGRGDFAGLTANLIFNRTSATPPQYTVHGLITEDE